MKSFFVFLLFALAVTVTVPAQNISFVQNNGVTMAVPYSSIWRVERSTSVSHDTRIYTGSSTFVTSSATFDSVALAATGKMFRVTQATTWKPYLFNPSLSVITKSSSNKAIVKVGTVSYTTTSDFDSLMTVIDEFSSGTSSVLGRQPFYRSQLSYSNGNLQNARVSKGYVGDDPTFTLSSTGLIYITMPPSITLSDGSESYNYASHKSHCHVQVIQTGGGDPTGIRATITYLANNTIMVKVYDANGDLTNAIGLYIFMEFDV